MKRNINTKKNKNIWKSNGVGENLDAAVNKLGCCKTQLKPTRILLV